MLIISQKIIKILYFYSLNGMHNRYIKKIIVTARIDPNWLLGSSKSVVARAETDNYLRI